MDIYILDTNLFFNMEAGLNLGKKTEEVMQNITVVAKKLKESKSGSFLMPPRIVDEVLSFFENKEQPFLKDLLASITIQSPSFNEMNVPASVVYQLVEDIRNRSYRGMTVAEEEIQNAGKEMMGKPELSKMEFQQTVGKAIKGFRERYRQATRFGFLDSLADLDLIMLSKETNGHIVSTDEGVIKWGRVFGIKEMPAHVFGTKMQAYL
jgi:RNA ligase partner protein